MSRGNKKQVFQEGNVKMDTSNVASRQSQRSALLALLFNAGHGVDITQIFVE